MKGMLKILGVTLILLAIPLLVVIGLFSRGKGHKVNAKDAKFKDEQVINPASGLPMVGSGGVDIAGNMYGTCDE